MKFLLTLSLTSLMLVTVPSTANTASDVSSLRTLVAGFGNSKAQAIADMERKGATELRACYHNVNPRFAPWVCEGYR